MGRRRCFRVAWLQRPPKQIEFARAGRRLSCVAEHSRLKKFLSPGSKASAGLRRAVEKHPERSSAKKILSTAGHLTVYRLIWASQFTRKTQPTDSTALRQTLPYPLHAPVSRNSRPRALAAPSSTESAKEVSGAPRRAKAAPCRRLPPALDATLIAPRRCAARGAGGAPARTRAAGTARGRPKGGRPQRRPPRDTKHPPSTPPCA